MVENRGCQELVYLRKTRIAMSEQAKGAFHFFAPSACLSRRGKKFVFPSDTDSPCDRSSGALAVASTERVREAVAPPAVWPAVHENAAAAGCDVSGGAGADAGGVAPARTLPSAH